MVNHPLFHRGQANKLPVVNRHYNSFLIAFSQQTNMPQCLKVRHREIYDSGCIMSDNQIDKFLDCNIIKKNAPQNLDRGYCKDEGGILISP